MINDGYSGYQFWSLFLIRFIAVGFVLPLSILSLILFAPMVFADVFLGWDPDPTIVTPVFMAMASSSGLFTILVGIDGKLDLRFLKRRKKKEIIEREWRIKDEHVR